MIIKNLDKVRYKDDGFILIYFIPCKALVSIYVLFLTRKQNNHKNLIQS